MQVRSLKSTGRGWAEWPILALGFRPFYLLAALFASAALPLWIGDYFGAVTVDGYLHGVAWHSHEMLFGFAMAVVAGFLLTAVRNWTGLPTPAGWTLGALAALWVLGRAMALTGPGVIAAAVDIAFLPALGVAIALPVWRARNTRNLKLLAVVAGLAIVNGVYHFAYLNGLPAAWSRVATDVALDVITLLMAIVGGRVIPAFTANAVSAVTPRRITAVETVSVGSLLVILAADVSSAWYSVPRPVWMALLATAALAHGIRLLLWQPYRIRGNALLAMLPIAYAWIPLALLLRLLAQAAVLPPAAATHALTIGAMSSLMLAMMMRSALGHTGRPLVAGPVEIIAFTLLQFAAIVRAIAGGVQLWPYREAVAVSGALWSLAFVVFLARYWAVLTRPRIDGRPG